MAVLRKGFLELPSFRRLMKSYKETAGGTLSRIKCFLLLNECYKLLRHGTHKLLKDKAQSSKKQTIPLLIT